MTSPADAYAEDSWRHTIGATVWALDLVLPPNEKLVAIGIVAGGWTNIAPLAEWSGLSCVDVEAALAALQARGLFDGFNPTPETEFRTKKMARPAKEDTTLVYWAVAKRDGVVHALKVGVSKDPAHRVRALNSGSYDDVELLHVEAGGRAREENILEELSPWNISGEWSAFTPEVQRALEEAMWWA